MKQVRYPDDDLEWLEEYRQCEKRLDICVAAIGALIGVLLFVFVGLKVLA